MNQTAQFKVDFMNDEIKKLANDIKKSEYLFALTGAGVSTLSGIPDFRTDKSGIWERHDQSRIFDIRHFKKSPKDFYRFAKETMFSFKNAKPGAAHKLLALLERKGILKSLATQNIDHLHQKAGSKKVFELHGNSEVSHCLTCNNSYLPEDIENILKAEDIPLCSDCGGIIKPDIVFYGEMLPESAIKSSMDEAGKCDMMLVLGTSLVVYPAAYLPEIALKNKSKLAILTKEPTHLDSFADYVINEDLGHVCIELMSYLE